MKKTCAEQEMQVICMGTDVIATSTVSTIGEGQNGSGFQPGPSIPLP